MRNNFLFLILIPFLTVSADPAEPTFHEEKKVFDLISKQKFQGEIRQGRYYAPKNVYSCKADDFGLGHYIAQDVLMDFAACVGFYNRKGDAKHVEILFMPPDFALKGLDEKGLKRDFQLFAIKVIKDVDNAQDIEILSEEMIDEKTLFVSMSIGKTDVLKNAEGNHLSTTRCYLVFCVKDSVVYLSNQKATQYGLEHNPQSHVPQLKSEILEFRKTLEFAGAPWDITPMIKKL